jgi:site-specific recombinase XerD
MHSIAPYVHSFFHQHLAAERGLSPNTIVCYRDSLKLLLQFAADRLKTPIDKLAIEHFSADVVLAFLNDLESTRGNSARTRNNRLAALRAFFRHVARQEPLLLQPCQRLCQIPLKKTPHQCIEYLEDHEVRALLGSVDLSDRNGVRDYALLLLLYNTGARVQEVVDLEIKDVHQDAPPQVRLIGKGNKERVCPLWHETVRAIQTYLDTRRDEHHDTALFLNATGQPITRFGIGYIVSKYAKRAATTCPSLANKSVSPHLMRHSTAMALLQSGNAITVVKDWLGHADVNTTHGYVEVNLEMKRKALEACQAPASPPTPRRRWQDPDLLKWLDELTTGPRHYVESHPSPTPARAASDHRLHITPGAT